MMPEGWQEAVAAVEAEISALQAQIANLQQQLGGGPSTVATFFLLGQAAPIAFPGTPLYTVEEDGEFRVNFYVSSSVQFPPAWGTPRPAVRVTWNDGRRTGDSALINPGDPVLPPPSAAIEAGVFPFHAVAGSSISLYEPNGSQIPYDVFVTVEKL